jgi:alpha-tubulin suppressor-like RCC1 family protein
MPSQNTPVLVSALQGKSIAKIYAGGNVDLGYSFAQTTTGRLWSWGRNKLGQLALGDEPGDKNLPQLVTLLPHIKKLSLGAYHAMALTIRGHVYAW